MHYVHFAAKRSAFKSIAISYVLLFKRVNFDHLEVTFLRACDLQRSRTAQKKSNIPKIEAKVCGLCILASFFGEYDILELELLYCLLELFLSITCLSLSEGKVEPSSASFGQKSILLTFFNDPGRGDPNVEIQL